jgi:hypothetical protein
VALGVARENERKEEEEVLAAEVKRTVTVKVKMISPK